MIKNMLFTLKKEYRKYKYFLSLFTRGVNVPSSIHAVRSCGEARNLARAFLNFDSFTD